MNSTFDNDAISFAERLLSLLDQGSFTSTYKYAVMLALMDVVVERASKSGLPPDFVTTRQLAEKVIEIYWPHTNEFSVDKSTSIHLLKQNTSGQAEIVTLINRFRQHESLGSYAPLFSAKYLDPKGYSRLVDKVEWKLIEMPLPKLQRMGKVVSDFVYSIAWSDDIRQGVVSQYQSDASSDFDNRIMLKPYVGEYFIRLSGLLRPLIQREWSRFVAQVNKLEEARLQKFLFDAERAAAAKFCAPLLDLQNHYCFYCHEKIGKSQNTLPQVDHFIPWARHPNDSLANYVVAHAKCNRDKRDHLAASQHVTNWLDRLRGEKTIISDLQVIAEKSHWELGDQTSIGVAAAIYQHIKPESLLWVVGNDFEFSRDYVMENIF